MVGAVAIGGAVTGSTHATWRDSAVLDAATIESGYLNVEISAETATLPELEPDSSVLLRFRVDTEGLGRNLASITSLMQTADSQVDIKFAVATDDVPCEATDLTWGDMSSAEPVPLTSEPVGPRSADVCLRITRRADNVPGGAINLAVEASTQQYRGSVATGWTDSDQLSLPLPAPAAEPADPDVPAPANFRCETSSAESSLTVRWDAVQGAGRYEVRRVADDLLLREVHAPATTAPITHNLVTNRGDDKVYVLAVRGDARSSLSNQLAISRNGNAMTCRPMP